MSTFMTDFSEFSLGSGAPSGFTQHGSSGQPAIVEDASSPGGKKLVYTSGFGARSWMLRTAETPSTQMEVRAIFVPATQAGMAFVGMTIARGDSTRTGYEAGVRDETFDMVTTRRAGPRRATNNDHTGGSTYTELYDWVEGVMYESLLVSDGLSLRYKIWEYGDPEPSGWLVDTTDGDGPITGGLPGVGGDNGEIHFHAWSYGTDGDPAPLLSEASEPENYDPASLDVVVAENSATLGWPAPAMADADFTDIFRRGPYATEGAVDNSPFDPKASTRIARVPIGTLTYQDTPPDPGWYAWQVFPVKLAS